MGLWGDFAVTAVLLAIPITLVFLLAQRWLVNSLTTGIIGFTTINPDNVVPVYLAGHVPGFVIYRIIDEIGVGLTSMLSPVYIAEPTPAHIHGKLVSFNQFAIIFG